MQWVSARNEVAHESMGSFAQLLNSVLYKDSAVYEKWQDAFPVVCQATLEDVCKAEAQSLQGLYTG